MKAIILARVSDKHQDSNEAQILRISEYVRHKNLAVWKTYEIEESSTQGDRTQFQQILKEIAKCKEPIALVVDTVDRLQRSFRESVILDDLRKAGQLELHFYRENLIINKDSNSADLLRWDIAVMFARSYILQLSDNVKRKLELKRLNGEWIGRAPIGYINVGEEKNNRDIIPDAKIRHLIVKIFELYETGLYSIKKVGEIVAKDGLRSPLGKQLATSMIDHILNNPFYYGEMRVKGKLYNHKYPPLINKALFDSCQRVKNGWDKKPFKYAAKQFIFRGLLRCAKCNCSMSPQIKKGKYVYYSCTNARKQICDKKIYVKEDDLLKPIYEILRTFDSIPQSELNIVLSELKKSTEIKDKYLEHTIKQLRLEYNQIQIKIGRIADLLIENAITPEVYNQKLKEYKDGQYDIDIQIREHTKADKNYYTTIATVLAITKNSLRAFTSSKVDEKRVIINLILQNSIVNGKNLEFTMRPAFEKLYEASKTHNWLPLLDIFRTIDFADIISRMHDVDILLN
ncbi:MAG: recombinase family protein [Bacteroidetes bacterium]|nr:recombinase family protein [Bacteroidota bacterium]